VIDFHLDPETHTYTMDGQVVPSVTKIIRAIVPGIEASDWHLQRGRAIHHGCSLFDKGVLDWKTVDPQIKPRIRAWELFRRDFPSAILMNESPLYHEQYRYAGTLDRLLIHEGNLFICDLKSTIEPWVKLQMGGYALMTLQEGYLCHGAVGVELGDEQYRTLWIDGSQFRQAQREFLACLTMFRFFQANGIKR
jgi:hypothetical protein